MVPNPQSWWLDWPLEPGVWLLTAAAGWWYMRAARSVRGWRVVRTTCWFGGLVATFIALASPVATYDTALFWVHMLQHLLLISVAAPLLLLGAPLALVLRSATPHGRRRVSAFLHFRWVRALTHPFVSWTVFAAVLVGSHFSPLYDAALENELVHVIEHVVYLTAGLLFWWPIVAVDPGANRLTPPLRLAYIALAMPVQAFVGLAIYSANTPLYSHYEELARTWGPSLMADQRLAGVVMWVGGDGVSIGAFIIAAVAWMRYEDRLAERVDRRLGLG
jgi:putative membrane protein